MRDAYEPSTLRQGMPVCPATRRMSRGLLTLAVVLLTQGAAGGLAVAEAEPLTFDRAVALALEQNPELLAAREELEVARGRIITSQFFTRFNPSVRGRGMNREFAEGGSGDQYQLLLSQEIEVAGQRRLRREAARRHLKRVEALVEDRERVLRGVVKRAFFQALVRRERLRLLRQVETFNQRVRDAAEQRFRAGASPIMEANLAVIRYGQSRKQTLSASAAYQAALIDLRRVLGLPTDRSVEPTGELGGVSKAVALSTLLARASRLRPDMAAAEREIARLQAERALTRRLAVPNPTFQFLYQTERERVAGSADTIIGGGVSIPLPLFDRNQGELVALGGRQQQARHRVAATARRIEQEVATALREYEAAGRALAVFQADVIDRVKDNFRFIEIAYREGKISLLQLIVVQNDLISAQLSYVDSQGDFRVAEANLEQAVGGAL